MAWLRERHPSLLLGLREDADSITLEKLIVPGGSRGRGLGSALMADLVDHADRRGKQLRLTPSGAFGASPRRLAGFYARFGFVPNEGDLHDPACPESMYRDPSRRRPVREAVARRIRQARSRASDAAEEAFANDRSASGLAAR
jgi:GNAT superfamily N-acetyltransferase